MSRFPIHTIESAPERAKPLFLALKQAVGMVPNLAAGMAESPQLLEGFLAVREHYGKGSFSGAEIEVLSLTAAFENDCSWCMAFHSLMAGKNGVPLEIVDALRAGRSPDDARLGPLSDFARAMVRGRGAVGEAERDRFLAAGYTPAQALEVVFGMGFSLMANYAGHLINPPLDQPLQAHAWHRATPLRVHPEPELTTR
ncbi:MAG TPA: carboxymuconolactone decarboxylase family protein [Gemmatimonadaceae bacterium]|nr:carboxymuconolactone decarboxylase family protein [Gemmatimonadaceae bacterium]